MGAHSATTSSSSSSSLLPGGAAVAATGLTVLGMVAGAGVAFAGDAPSGSAQDTVGSSECSVGGTPAGGSGTGSPDGVITNGQCSPEQIEQAQHDADTDGDPNTRGSFASDSEDEDTAGGNPNVVGGTGDGVSSQSGTAQKADATDADTSATSDRSNQGDPEPALAGVL